MNRQALQVVPTIFEFYIPEGGAQHHLRVRTDVSVLSIIVVRPGGPKAKASIEVVSVLADWGGVWGMGLISTISPLWGLIMSPCWALLEPLPVVGGIADGLCGWETGSWVLKEAGKVVRMDFDVSGGKRQTTRAVGVL
jgi:hypothetical protein